MTRPSVKIDAFAFRGNTAETMTFDSLTHVTPDGRWFGTKFDAGEDRLLREMDRAGVDRAVVVALAGHIENSYVRAVAARHPDRLIAGLSIDPTASTAEATAVGIARELRDTGPFRALKLHPRLNRYDPLDRRCLDLLQELASWANPPRIWLDTLFYYRGGRLSHNPVETIHRIVNQFPSLQFVLLHGSGTWLMQTAEAIRDCPNAFLDLSFTLCRYEGSSLGVDLGHLLRNFDRRIVFGSDFPEITPAESLEAFARIAGDLSEEKRSGVLGGNLEKILEED